MAQVSAASSFVTLSIRVDAIEVAALRAAARSVGWSVAALVKRGAIHASSTINEASERGDDRAVMETVRALSAVEGE